MPDKLKQLREQIDQIDRKLLALLSERARCAQQVGEAKREVDGDAAQLYRPDREAAILRKILQENDGPLADEEMARLFREVMSACLALEKPLTVAFLGPEGTFTEEAALKHFGHSVSTMPLNSISEVFREVESGSANYGVVPIENSTEGIVSHTLDSFMESSLKLTGEVELRIHDYLLSHQMSLDEVQVIYSHQQSFAQCRKWLDANVPQAERKTVASNAQACILAAREKGAAAIAGKFAAERYDLQVLSTNIEDSPDNTTRFLIIGKSSPGPSGSDKTSVLVSASNRPGALYELLAPFAQYNVGMTRIESRPSQCVNWEYVFFLDLEGHVDEAPMAAALEELNKVADMVNILGSYPRAVLL